MYTQPCVSNLVRKTNRLFSRSDSVQVIYAVHEMLQPPDCVPTIQSIPDILHESYLVFTSNLPLHRIIRPLATHRRLHRITKLALTVKIIFCIFRRIFNYFFVKAHQSTFAPTSCVFPPNLTLFDNRIISVFSLQKQRKRSQARPTGAKGSDYPTAVRKADFFNNIRRFLGNIKLPFSQSLFLASLLFRGYPSHRRAVSPLLPSDRSLGYPSQ